MKRVLSLFIALSLILACAVMSACSDNQKKEYPVTLGDVTIDQEPESIVVLSDNLADIIACIGYDIKLVGRSAQCDQSTLSIVPSVGTADNPSIDTIVQKGADLVLADSTLSQRSRDMLAAEGIPCIIQDVAPDALSLKDLYHNLGAVLGGKIAGAEKADKAYADLFDLLDQFQTASTGIVQTSAYLYIDQNGQLCTFIKGSLEQMLVGYNGTMNVFANQEEAAVDSARLRMAAPTYIFYDSEETLSYLKNDEKLARLDAVENERTCMIPLKWFQRQGNTYETVVYNMIDFINEQEKLAASQALTEPETEAPTAAPTKAPKEKPTEDEVVSDDSADEGTDDAVTDDASYDDSDEGYDEAAYTDDEAVYDE